VKNLLLTALALTPGLCNTTLQAQEVQGSPAQSQAATPVVPADIVAQANAAVPGSVAAKAPSQMLGEIVVTAEHRKENVQKAALSITVLSGDALGEKGISNARDMINAVPGLAVTSTGPSANLSLRGVGSGGGGANTDPTVSFNLDGVNLARQFSTTASLYDLQRVEVLKGPQGTLYGRNATVGAINVVPNRPGFKFEGAVGMDMGNYKNFGTTGMINLPFSNTAALRIAFKSAEHDGYLTNGYNDAKNQAARIGLLLKPNSDLSVYLSADLYHDGSKGPSTVFLFPNNTTDRWQDAGNPWFAYSPPGCGNVRLCPTFGDGASAQGPQIANVKARAVTGSDGYMNNDQAIFKSEIEWKLNASTLTVIPAFVNTKIDYKSNSSGYQQIVLDNVKQKSLEARLASNSEGPWKWVIGGFAFNERQDSTFDTLEAAGYQTLRNPLLDDTSYAAFGQSTYSLTKALRLTGGLRFTKETKEQNGYLILDGFVCTPAALAGGGTVVLPNLQQPTGGCNVPVGGNLSFKSTDYKVGVEYDLAAQSLLYATVSTGFKAGGFWPGLPPNTYKPEKLTAYSFGLKNRLFDNSLQANFELFYWDYKNQGIGLVSGINPAGIAGRIYNTDGFIKGAEMNIVYLLTAEDRLSLDLLLQDGKYKSFPLAASTNIVTSFAADLPRLNSPHGSGTISYEHTWDFASGSNLIFGARSHIESSTWLNASHLNGSARAPYHLSNMTLTYVEPNAKWRVTGYVDNVENEAVVYTGPSGTISRGVLFRPAANPNALYAAISAPRTYGIRVGFDF
jgi:iron complex outermembrane recepter protein